MATPKQVHWVQKCMEERVVPDDLAKRANALLADAEHTACGDLLTLLFACKRKDAGKPKPWVILASDYPAIKPGRYATHRKDGNGLDFFLVRTGEEVDAAKYAGQLFVKRIKGGRSPFRIEHTEARALLDAVTDVAKDQKRFGLKLKRCPGCGHDLTEEVSQEVGWGPDCAAERGIYHPGYTKTGKPKLAALV